MATAPSDALEALTLLPDPPGSAAMARARRELASMEGCPHVEAWVTPFGCGVALRQGQGGVFIGSRGGIRDCTF